MFLKVSQDSEENTCVGVSFYLWAIKWARIKKNFFLCWVLLSLTLLLLIGVSLNYHCVKSVQKRSFFWSVFFHIRTEYEVSLRIHSECGKIRTKKNSAFGHFSRSVSSRKILSTHFRLVFHSIYNLVIWFVVEMKWLLSIALQKKWNFTLMSSSVNVIKSAVSGGVGILNGKLPFYAVYELQLLAEMN